MYRDDENRDLSNLSSDAALTEEWLKNPQPRLGNFPTSDYYQMMNHATPNGYMLLSAARARMFSAQQVANASQTSQTIVSGVTGNVVGSASMAPSLTTTTAENLKRKAEEMPSDVAEWKKRKTPMQSNDNIQNTEHTGSQKSSIETSDVRQETGGKDSRPLSSNPQHAVDQNKLKSQREKLTLPSYEKKWDTLKTKVEKMYPGISKEKRNNIVRKLFMDSLHSGNVFVVEGGVGWSKGYDISGKRAGSLCDVSHAKRKSISS